MRNLLAKVLLGLRAIGIQKFWYYRQLGYRNNGVSYQEYNMLYIWFNGRRRDLFKFKIDN